MKKITQGTGYNLCSSCLRVFEEMHVCRPVIRGPVIWEHWETGYTNPVSGFVSSTSAYPAGDMD